MLQVKRLKILLSAIIFLAGAGAGPLLAQTADPQAKEELVSQAERLKESLEPSPPIRDEVSEIISEEPAPEAAPESETPFFVKKIQFEGHTLFSEQDFLPYAQRFENRRTTLTELKGLTQLVTNHYRSHGFTTSRAYIPPQKLSDETVTVKIIEAKVHRVMVEDNRYFSKFVYENALRLRPDRIFNYTEFESDIYFLNQKPDIQAKAYLLPGDEPATSDIVLKAKETYPLHASYELNNRGTKLTHRSRSLFHLDHNNLTGRADRLNTVLSLSEEGAVTAGVFSYALPVDRTGTTYRLSGVESRSMVVKHFKSLEVKGEYRSLTPGLTQTFIRRRDFTLEGLLDFEIKDSKTLVDDFKTDFDRLRILSAGAQFSWRDASGRTFFLPQARWGIPDFLGSSDSVNPLASVTNTGGEFLVGTASLVRIQRIPGPSLLLLKANGQWTKDSLPSPEQFRAGGALSVRGYPESDAAGDTGYNLSGEWQWPVGFLPESWQVPFTNKKWRDSLRLVGFLDGAKTFIRERSLSTDVKDKFLLGSGVGLRMDLDRFFSLQADWGYPLGDESGDEDNPIFHFYLKVGF